MTGLKRSLLALPLALVLLLAAPAAYAQTWTHTDAARDVLVDRYDESMPPLPIAPGRGDLTKLSVRYDADVLQVASTIRAEHCGYYWELRVATSRGDTFVFSRGAASSDGCVEPAVRARRNSYAFTCQGLVVSTNSVGIVARIPRSCLGSAYRVRVGVQLSTHDDFERGSRTEDDAYRTGKVTWREPRLSPWVVRAAAA